MNVFPDMFNIEMLFKATAPPTADACNSTAPSAHHSSVTSLQASSSTQSHSVVCEGVAV